MAGLRSVSLPTPAPSRSRCCHPTGWRWRSPCDEGHPEAYVMSAEEARRAADLPRGQHPGGRVVPPGGRVLVATDWRRPFPMDQHIHGIPVEGGEPSLLPVGPGEAISFQIGGQGLSSAGTAATRPAGSGTAAGPPGRCGWIGGVMASSSRSSAEGQPGQPDVDRAPHLLPFRPRGDRKPLLGDPHRPWAGAAHRPRGLLCPVSQQRRAADRLPRWRRPMAVRPGRGQDQAAGGATSAPAHSEPAASWPQDAIWRPTSTRRVIRWRWSPLEQPSTSALGGRPGSSRSGLVGAAASRHLAPRRRASGDAQRRGG